jgi:lipopolysaccharide biosynthesis regulator YciM
LQEIISAEQRKRLLDEIGNRKREINDAVEAASRRNLSQQDRNLIDRIRSFVELSDQAAGRGDMRQADALSERALVLARELKGAR